MEEATLHIGVPTAACDTIRRRAGEFCNCDMKSLWEKFLAKQCGCTLLVPIPHARPGERAIGTPLRFRARRTSGGAFVPRLEAGSTLSDEALEPVRWPPRSQRKKHLMPISEKLKAL